MIGRSCLCKLADICVYDFPQRKKENNTPIGIVIQNPKLSYRTLVVVSSMYGNKNTVLYHAFKGYLEKCGMISYLRNKVKSFLDPVEALVGGRCAL